MHVVFLESPSFTSYDLRVVPVDGSSAAIELSGPTGTVQWFVLSPDETLVAFVADQVTSNTFELFVAPIDGSSAAVKLSGALPAGGQVQATSMAFAPDGSRVLYLASQQVAGRIELYSAPSDGSSAAVKLNGTLAAAGSDVDSFRTSPNAARVVYAADQDADGRLELYSVPIDGSSAAVKINGPMVAAGDVTADSYRITPDGARVVYRADQDMDERFDLYSAPISGAGPVVRLSSALGPTRDVQPEFLVLADSSAALFRADADVDERYELWLAPLDGSAPARRANGRIFSAQGDVQADFQLTPGETHVLYRSDVNQDELVELYRFPLEPQPPLQGATRQQRP
jgi:hypothetical protein